MPKSSIDNPLNQGWLDGKAAALNNHQLKQNYIFHYSDYFHLHYTSSTPYADIIYAEAFKKSYESTKKNLEWEKKLIELRKPKNTSSKPIKITKKCGRINLYTLFTEQLDSLDKKEKEEKENKKFNPDDYINYESDLIQKP